MGWFEEQIKKRKKLDEQTFEESFLSLAMLGGKGGKGEEESALRDRYVISQILGYFRHQVGDLPSSIKDIRQKVDYAIRPYDVLHHNVELSASTLEDNATPILAFTKTNHTPVVFLPRGSRGFYYVNYQTGKKVSVDEAALDGFEAEAMLFYRPLPGKTTGIGEFIRYLRASIRPLDIFLLILLSVSVAGVGLLLPFLTRLLTGEVVEKADQGFFLSIALYVVASALGLLLVRSIKGFVDVRISILVEKSVKSATMMRVLSLPPSFFKKFNTGELTARFKAVTQLSEAIVEGVSATLSALLMSLAHLVQLVGFAPSLLAPVIAVMLASGGFTVLVAFLRRSHMRKVLELDSKEAGVTYEMINGIQKVRLSGSEKRVFAKWAASYSRAAKTRYRPPLILRLAPAISIAITLLGQIAIYFVAAKNQVSVADYMAFTTSFGVLSGAVASLADTAGLAATIQPIYELARPILAAEPESAHAKAVLPSLKGNLRFEDVSFQYNEGGPWILNHLDLDIHEGEYVALVGPTGCGKSTFVRLLLGFETPSSGHVYVDGVDMEDLDLAALRRGVGTVLQNGTLFHADILSNILISAPGLSESDAWEAARIADIAKDIEALPMKMKTIISEGQGGISGGQKQRIMIARAIVHKPKVLVFDEATSALDNKTQRNISDAIAKLNCTRIVIAHRLSTIKHADRILMLEGGRIIESGSYEELLALNGRFAELVERQRLETD